MSGAESSGGVVQEWLAPKLLLCKTCCLVAIIIPCLSAFLFGASVLFSVIAVRHVSVTWVHASFPLSLDYRGEAAIGTASFAAIAPPPNPKVPGDVSRIVKTGEKLDVMLELVVPNKADDYELFHVTGELLSTNDSVLATSTISFLNSQKTTLLSLARKVLLLPLSLFEWWWKSPQTINLEMFTQYVESEGFPAKGIRVKMEARHMGALPKVSDAKVHLGRNLGLVGQALFLMRPSGVPTLILLMVGFSFLTVGGMGCCLPLLALLLSADHEAVDGNDNIPVGSATNQTLDPSPIQSEGVGESVASTGQETDIPNAQSETGTSLRKRRA
ncbi:hypothetical protein BSKO_00178 [Bryopsis sp. KO-2023]|nr:hypothetical protein BSKO_00178 [Bryopsis sp. KO-2023]